jgi:hydroxymethylpyrimidine pyrophosphatase-like HAD family hydrolase
MRGVFLSAGTLADPRLDYRVEFLLKDEKNATALRKFIDAGFSPRLTKRRAEYVVYIKGNERAESFCALIGAELATIDIIEKSIEKETMSSLNRSCNCEHANMQKTVNASVRIRQAITRLRESGRFNSLPDDLKLTAELREKYPDMNISKISLMRHLSDDDLKMLESRFPVVYAHDSYAEIPTEGHNKATGIARVCEYYGVDVSRSIAMGDSGNDDEMVKYAGIGVAMGNATDAIKSAADFITVDCAEGGVAYALEKILWEQHNS